MHILLTVFIVLSLASCKDNNEPGTPAESNEHVSMTAQKFVGSWDLKVWTAESADGQVVHPFGDDAQGRITYDSQGNMAVQIMKKNRASFQSEDPLQAQPDEVFEAYNGYIGYSGRYKVNPDTNQVIHQIRISSFPNWVGQDQARYYKFHEDKLTLSTDLIGSSRHKLTWQKVKEE